MPLVNVETRAHAQNDGRTTGLLGARLHISDAAKRLDAPYPRARLLPWGDTLARLRAGGGGRGAAATCIYPLLRLEVGRLRDDHLLEVGLDHEISGPVLPYLEHSLVALRFVVRPDRVGDLLRRQRKAVEGDVKDAAVCSELVVHVERQANGAIRRLGAHPRPVVDDALLHQRKPQPTRRRPGRARDCGRRGGGWPLEVGREARGEADLKVLLADLVRRDAVVDNALPFNVTHHRSGLGKEGDLHLLSSLDTRHHRLAHRAREDHAHQRTQRRAANIHWHVYAQSRPQG
mmetsp:Transcript_442/g.901  ORF Transcript_442/g.901 Transcript_442/m.901 type:complete len:289 (+) Transcript_442:17-883(+)